MKEQCNTFLSNFDNEGGKKWDNHKLSNDKISFYYLNSSKKEHRKYSARMEKCAEFLTFKFQNSDDVQKLKLKKANFCRVRLCPVCLWRRSMYWRARLFQNLPTLLETKKYKFLFLTLTVKNCPVEELSLTLKMMNEGWNRMRLKKEFKAIKGFIRATEVTKGVGNLAHPHFHCILAVSQSYFKSKQYLKQTDWVNIWRLSCRLDYDPIVDIRKIKVTNNSIETKAVIETLKYTTKVSDLLEDKNWFLCLSDQLKNKRFLATGGCFKSILKEDLTNKEMLGLDDEDINEDLELIFNWDKGFSKYRRVK